jgi:hypothetical protein
MALAYFVLQTGRDVEMTSLAVRLTYGGFLEGYPHPRMNDAILAGLAERDVVRYPPPKHVIQPPRTRPEQLGREGAFGPVEELPAVICSAKLVSHPVDEDLDGVLYRSWLTVAWFQESVDEPIARFVGTAIADLDWNRLAEDFEL